LSGKAFDLLLCIEGYHCLSNVDAFLSGAHSMIKEGGSLVIADTFDKKDMQKIEAKFTEDHEFFIHKKEVITFNVKHAM
jgi:2-polyprenyl-3-methyl-5-hydroxy-6-metoxy-1,4-benzoquinol methylase